MKYAESTLQQNCIKWFRYQYPRLAKLLFAVPNGGRRDVIEAKRLKAEGVVSGAPDLILLIGDSKYNALCIEMKAGKGKQSDNQKEWQQAAEKAENKYVVCRSFDEFKREIEGYLK